MFDLAEFARGHALPLAILRLHYLLLHHRETIGSFTFIFMSQTPDLHPMWLYRTHPRVSSIKYGT